MARMRRVNKVPLRTVALSEPLLEKMEKSKDSRISWDCFINRVFHEWVIAKQQIKDFEEAKQDEEAIVRFKQKQQELTKEEEAILQLG